MISRLFVNRIVISSIKIQKMAQNPKQFKIHRKFQTPINSQIRMFSQELNPELLTADFDYVKKATEDKNICIIDVREPDEIKEYGKIPNSLNIPLGNVSTSLGAMSDKDFESIYKRPKPKDEDEIIFYCMIGKRSGMAQQNAINIGFKNTKNYVGSWTDWASKTNIRRNN